MTKQIKSAVKSVLKSTSKVLKGKKIVQASSLPLAEREVMFREDLQHIMAKYNIGLSVATVDQTPSPLPVIEA